jgi:hypothetical protein
MRTSEPSKCRLLPTTKSTTLPLTKPTTAGKHHDHIQLLNYQFDAEEEQLTFILPKPVVTLIYSRLAVSYKSHYNRPLLTSFTLLIESDA